MIAEDSVKGALAEYYLEAQEALNASFSSIRRSHQSAGVKGGQNEAVVADFLESNTPFDRIRRNVEIIDSEGRISRETDVVVCNEYQVFMGSSPAIVIAEGVEFIIEVKAVLDRSEIDRVLSNSRSVKSLERQFTKGDLLNYGEHTAFFVRRVPYFVIAFETRLSQTAIRDHLAWKCAEIPEELQPDGIFVLNSGAIVNMRDGRGHTWTNSDNEACVGWVASLGSPESALLEFVKYQQAVTPRIVRWRNPLSFYLPEGRQTKIVGDTVDRASLRKE